MAGDVAATRVVVYLTEDDRAGHHAAHEVLLERAKAAGIAGATAWRAIEGFGASGIVRAARLPDSTHGLPIMVELIDSRAKVEAYLPVVAEIAPGSLVTIEEVLIVEVSHSTPA